MSRRRPRPPRLYAVADAEALGAGVADGAGEAAVERLRRATRTMAAGGVRWIQLRAKRLADRDLERAAGACARELAGTGARLWIDDRPDVAALVGAAGVHLGQRDLPPRAARKTVGERVWIGRSTHDLEQLAAAAADPDVDVVAIGPIYSTTGKEDPDPVVGLDLLRRARELTDKPLVAIGGIDAGRAGEVLAAGADSVAAIGAVCRGDVADGCRRMLAATGGAA